MDVLQPLPVEEWTLLREIEKENLPLNAYVSLYWSGLGMLTVTKHKRNGDSRFTIEN